MSGYDYDRPFVKQTELEQFISTDKETRKKYGQIVLAKELSNIEYKTRFSKLKSENNMKPPPSCGRIFPGFLVIRKLNQSGQYETWMPDHVFDELYTKQ